MKLRPFNRSTHPKWVSQDAPKHLVELAYRPRLNMWDVLSLEKRFFRSPNWFMNQKTDRFETKLEALLFILKNFSDGTVEVIDRHTNEVITYTTKDFEMMDKAVSTVTLIFGKDSRLVTDEQIFSHIKRLEDEARSLNSINNKPKKLEAKIAAIKADIESLVQVVDNR